MKGEVITLFLGICLVLQIKAQPVLQRSVIPPVGSSATFIQSNNYKAFNVGASGANVTWNFSTVDTSAGYYTEKIVRADTTWFYVNFPSIVNYAIEYKDIFGDNDYIYHRLDSTVFESYSTRDHVYSNPQKLMAFPFAYTNQFTDGFHSDDSTFFGITNVMADAYGTLKLPTGVFTNTLRVKTMDRYREITDRDAFGRPSDSLMYEADIYRWFSPNYVGPLLEYSKLVSYYNVGAVRVNVDTAEHLYLSTYYNSTVNSLASIQNIEAKAYPNPVENVLHISANEPIQDVNIYDVTGKCIKVVAVASRAFTISVLDLTPGLYLCKLQATDGKEKQFMFIRN